MGSASLAAEGLLPSSIATQCSPVKWDQRGCPSSQMLGEPFWFLREEQEASWGAGMSMGTPSSLLQGKPS